MRCYGNVKGFVYRNPQPEPMLTCQRCGKKRLERHFVEGGRRYGVCSRCRKKVTDAYERAMETDRRRMDGLRDRSVCAMCGRSKPKEDFAGHNGSPRKCCRECLAKQREGKR